MTATVPVEARARRVQEPSLTASVCGLLQVLTRGAKEGNSIRLERGGGKVLGISAGMNVAVRDVSAVWVPVPVLRKCLEEFPDLRWRASLPVMHGRAGLEPETVSAVACSFTVHRVNQKPDRPGSTYVGPLVWPEDRIAEILSKLEALSVPPTLVIDALPDLVAVWALDRPMKAAEPAEQDTVTALVRSLAARLDGDVPADDVRLSDLSVPLPGSAPANPGAEWVPVSVVAFHPSRVYSQPDLEAAIAAKKAK